MLEPFAKRGITVFGADSEEEIAGNDLDRSSLTVMLLDIDPTFYRQELFSHGKGRDWDRHIARLALSTRGF